MTSLLGHAPDGAAIALDVALPVLFIDERPRLVQG